MKFNFNGRLYELSFDSKPILKEDGNEITGKTFSILKDYIDTNSIGVPVLDGKGKPKNTHILAKDFLRFYEPEPQVLIKNKEIKSKTKRVKKPKVLKSILSQNADSVINEIIGQIDFDRMSKKNKLLIIPCSSSKVSGGLRANNQNYFLQNNQNGVYEEFLNQRFQRSLQYIELLHNNAAYFEKKGGNQSFIDIFNEGNLLPAFVRYAGTRSDFYKPALTNLYCNKNRNTNLHILIISGLYGVIEFRDAIINYHLKINGPNACWMNVGNFTLRNSVQQYMDINNIEGDNVFYAVSPSNYDKALKPLGNWKSLWVDIGRGSNSAKCVRRFLENLI
jgi:cytoplasmic iron level regulating protein YaaA (DUF328/UPF0246 family)